MPNMLQVPVTAVPTISLEECPMQSPITTQVMFGVGTGLEVCELMLSTQPLPTAAVKFISDGRPQREEQQTQNKPNP